MVFLAFFALIAGAGTAISPCVLPVLPALLSAAGSGGKRRPLGVVTGLTVTFTITIVGLSSVVNGVGLGSSFTRDIAIFALLVFGAAVLIPKLGDRLEAPLSRLARFGPKDTGEGFTSGLGVGAALGFVYAPCAGPILAAVIAVSAATGKTFVIGFAYALGSAIVLFALALGGRSLLDRVRKGGHGMQVQQALGAVMVLTAIAMTFSLDTRFQTAIADHLPAALVNPTKGLEDSRAVKDRLADLHGKSRFEKAQDAADEKRAKAGQGEKNSSDGAAVGKDGKTTGTPPEGGGATGSETAASTAAAANGSGLAGVKTPTLDKLGPAPDFTGTGQWFNTANGQPLTLKSLRGKVGLIDFWTYTCINCIRTLPYVKAWDAKYRSKGLVIVGVHSPEFDFEKKTSNVSAAIKQNKIKYPVVQDNDLKTWDAWSNQYWPAEYLIDAKGQVRHTQFGEGNYKESEAAIRALLAERGDKDLGPGASASGIISVAKSGLTPETYLGTSRSRGFTPEPQNGTRTYKQVPADKLEANAFSFGGKWNLTDESATAVKGARLDVNFNARHVYLVMSSKNGTPRTMNVNLDGKPFKRISVTGQQLYTLVDLPSLGEHHLGLQLPTGVSGYAFTFG